MSIGTEMLADFAPQLEVEVDLVRLDAPKRLPQDGIWVFSRKEE